MNFNTNFMENPSEQGRLWIASVKVNVNVEANLCVKANDHQENQAIEQPNKPKSQSCVQKVVVCFLFPFEITFLLVYTFFIRFRNIAKYFFPGSPKRLSGEIILVTGGGSGLGREICCHLAKQEQNLTIVSWDADEKKNLETIGMLHDLGLRSAFAFTVDVRDREQVFAAAEKVRKEVGDVTILFNTVGIHGVVDEAGSGWRQDPRTVENVFAVNVLSHCWTLREFLPRMIERRRGHIVEICSVLGFLPFSGSAEYVGSKFALRGYFQRIREELRHLQLKHDVLISLVYPNFTNVETDSECKPQVGFERYFFFNRKITFANIAGKIVHGMRRRKENIYVPEESRLLHLMANFFPEEVIGRVLDFAGLTNLDGIQD